MGAPRTCCSTILAFILPPVAVALARGCGCQLLLNILLTLCGFLPGMVHALFIICLGDEDDRRQLPTTNPGPTAQQHMQPQPVPYPQGAQPVIVGHPVMPPHPQQPNMYPAVPPPGYPPAKMA